MNPSTCVLLLLFSFFFYIYLVVRAFGSIRQVRMYNLKKEIDKLNRHSLYTKLNLLDVLETEGGIGLVVRKDGSFAAGLGLPGVGSYYYDADRLNDLSQRKEALFRKIPVDDHLKISLFYRIRHDVSDEISAYYASANHRGNPAFINLINENYRRFLEENNSRAAFRRVDMLFVIEKKFRDRFETGGLFMFSGKLWEGILQYGITGLGKAVAGGRPYLLKKAIIQRVVSEHEKKVQEFKEIFDSLQKALADIYDTESGKIKPLTREEVEKVLFESLNPGIPYERYRDFVCAHPTDKLYYTDIFEGRKFINVGGELRTVISLTDLPKQARPDLLRPIAISNMDVDIVYHYKNPDQRSKRRKLTQYAKLAKQKAMNMDGTARTGALAANQVLQEAEQMRAEVELGEKRIGELVLQLVVYAPHRARNLEELYRAEKALSDACLTLENKLQSIDGVKIYREDVAAITYALDNVPFLARTERMGREIDCLSSWAAKLVTDECIPKREPLANCKVLLTTERQELYGINPFSETLVPNYNTLIVGAPGTGKSMFARKLLSRFAYKQPLRMITVTRGDDWNDFYRSLGGLSLDVDIDLGRVINIFDCPENKPGDGFLQSLVALLLYMCHEQDDAFNSVLLTEALGELYKKARIIKRRVRMTDFVEVLEVYHHRNERMVGLARTFGIKLSKYTHGFYAKLFDTPTHEDFYASVSRLCFNLDKLRSDEFLETAYAFILPVFINEQVHATDAPTIVVYDECWAFLKNKSLSKVVEDNFRTARKYNSGVMALAQNFEDFKGNGKFVIETTATKVIFRQEGDMEYIKEVLKLSNATAERLKTLPSRPQNYSEYLLIHGDGEVFIRDFSTSFDVAAFGSSRKQIEDRRLAMSQANAPEEAIFRLVCGAEAAVRGTGRLSPGLSS